MNTIWPHLSYEEAKDTYQTLHLWTQIIGKIKLDKLPWINHSWHVTFAVTPTGLTTSLLPYDKGAFQIEFNFITHTLLIVTSNGQHREIHLRTFPVAQFFSEVKHALAGLGIRAKIHPLPNEMEKAIPFYEDYEHAAYNREQVKKLHTVLVSTSNILTEFRSRFIGKCSPVHFFWGSFDIAVSRFCGRRAPAHPGGIPHLPDRVAQEAYSHEVSSAGFWPGNDAVPYPAFYSYIYPEPPGFKEVRVLPEEAFYHKELGEFILPYQAVQKAKSPETTLLDFLQSTYEAAANSAGWNREDLEKAEIS